MHAFQRRIMWGIIEHIAGLLLKVMSLGVLDRCERPRDDGLSVGEDQIFSGLVFMFCQRTLMSKKLLNLYHGQQRARSTISFKIFSGANDKITP